ncbi:hypothetical protein AB1Y20_006459 [Prymnesium parvum]|uniref:EGF-like domain-containing protein n=1 Tax=Prymnesium parvum TaxID=97485 RepID=A0AB34J1P9_PRYPA
MFTSLLPFCFSKTDAARAVWRSCFYECPPVSSCSEHGICFFGRCFCEPGFDGSTCDRRARSVVHCNYSDINADYCLQHPDYGVAIVPETRWKVAQQAEARLWATSKSNKRGDRAAMHVKQFGGYRVLPPGSLGHVAELGCGPWTQTFFLLKARPDITAERVTLVDPGIHEYVANGMASYRSGFLRGVPVELLPVGAEQVPHSYDARFDVVVMINVIEHTFNAFATLHSAYRLLKERGLFIYQERVVELGAAPQVYHPVRLKRVFHDWWLEKNYVELYRFRGMTTEVRRKRRTHGISSEVYFIGTKRESFKNLRDKKRACNDGTAYASVLGVHGSTKKSTFLQAHGSLEIQLQLVEALVRSLRETERCHRDFVLFVTSPDEVPITSKWMDALEADGVKLRTAKPLILGSPASDKLHVWKMTDYSKVLVLDSDVMVMRSLDDIFEEKRSFVVAHHPTDQMQALCGIPAERRGVGAMYLMRPSDAVFLRLLDSIRSFQVSIHHFSHYGEQTGLNCFFKNDSATLPSDYLYDLNSPVSDFCAPGATVHECSERFRRSCNRWSLWTMRQACVRIDEGASLPLEKSECDRFAGAAVCDQSIEHARRVATWSTNVRAVHFKGKMKPWRHAQTCKRVSLGPLVLSGDRTTRINATDRLIWNGSSCHNDAHKPVAWADGAPVHSYLCCSTLILLSSIWYGKLR